MYIMNTDKCTRGAVAHSFYSFPSLCIYHSFPLFSTVMGKNYGTKKRDWHIVHTHAYSLHPLKTYVHTRARTSTFTLFLSLCFVTSSFVF